MNLTVGKPVKRDDGRFYVPLNRAEQVKGVSTVARVASDAFPNLTEAVAFAKLLATFWNDGISFEGSEVSV